MNQPKRAARACVPCATRKVRCNGQQPCQSCSHNGIACTFRVRDASARSRAQNKRGRIIESLRPHDRDSQSQPPLAVLQIRPQGRGEVEVVGNVPPVDGGFLRELLSDYMDSVYTVCPVLDETAMKGHIQVFGSSAEDTALCYAYAAVTIATGPSEHTLKRPEVIQTYISRALKLRPPIGRSNDITLARVVFAVFLRITFALLQDGDMDFFYMREAITMLQMTRLGEEEPAGTSVAETLSWQRLRWVVFIQERVACICHERKAIIETCPAQWGFSDKLLANQVRVAFSHMTQLYRLVDDEFLHIWRDKQNSKALTQEWVNEKQRAFAAQQMMIEESLSSLTNLQQVDLVLTCQWLRTVVWQMAGYKHMLHSDALQDYMLLLFPVQGSVYVGNVLRNISRESLNRQGMGNLQKLFEITDMAADVLSLSAGLYERTQILGWMENCCFLIRWLQEFTQLSRAQRRLLGQKLESLAALMADT